MMGKKLQALKWALTTRPDWGKSTYGQVENHASRGKWGLYGVAYLWLMASLIITSCLDIAVVGVVVGTFGLFWFSRAATKEIDDWVKENYIIKRRTESINREFAKMHKKGRV